MADVLLVYVRDDEALAEGISDSLERSGLSVARGESVFDVGDEVPCVVVLWSASSTRSAMVRDVAIRAQREGKLVAARLAGCETPLGFARPAPHDLSVWRGDPDDPVLDPVFFAADRLVCAARLGGARRQESGPPPSSPLHSARARLGDQPPPRTARVEPDSAPQQPDYAPRPRTSPPPDDGFAHGLPPNVTEEALAWKRIEQSKDPKDYLDYLSLYGPHGIFCELAQLKLDKLTQKSKPTVGSFIPHNPSPHIAREKAKPARAEPERRERRAPEPPRAPAWRDDVEPPPERRPAPEPRPVSRARVEWREAPEPDYEPEPIRRPPPRPVPQRTATNRPRRRVEPAREVRAGERAESGGLPWRPLIIVALMAAGGIAFVQTLPKQSAPSAADAPPDFADAPRAGPAETTGLGEGGPDAPVIEPAATIQSLGTVKPAARTQLAMATPRTAPQPPRRQRSAEAPTPAPVITFRPPSEAPPANVTAPPTSTPTPSIVASSQAAPAQAAPPNPYVDAIWLRRPSGASLAKLYPPRALQRGVPGQASLDCSVLGNGQLSCGVTSESPAGFGFGAAASKAAAAFVAAPKAADGADAYGKRTRVTIRFQPQ
jgi:protein TonB